ncbi:MAG: MFS transporter [SAR324 cluster bacterium]|nr:MFS transporter [SAR324 cluster bacterium]
MSALKGDSLVAGGRWRFKVAARLAPLSPNFKASRRSAFWSLMGDHWPFYGLLFLVGSENFLVPLLIPAMAEEIERGVGALATMVTAYAVTHAVTAPLFGTASDRLGRSPLILDGGLSFLAGNLLVAGASMVALTMWFVASGAFATTQQILLTLAAPTMKGAAVSWNNSIMHAGAGAGIWVIGVGRPHGLSVGTIGLGFGLAAAACAGILTKVESKFIKEG